MPFLPPVPFKSLEDPVTPLYLSAENFTMQKLNHYSDYLASLELLAPKSSPRIKNFNTGSND
jgi:hypothetical protein